MDDELKIILAFVILFLLGVFITLISHCAINSYQDSEQLITQCEKELPRNQHCVLYAKPEKQND